MKKVLLALLVMFSINSVVYSQDFDEYKATLNSLKTKEGIKFEGKLPLQNGKDEFVYVKLLVGLNNITPEEFEGLIGTLWSANAFLENNCNNKLTYVPKDLFIVKNDEGIITIQLKGWAKNAYGVEGEVVGYFKQKGNKFLIEESLYD